MMTILKLILLWNVCVIAAVVALLWMFCAACAGSRRAWVIAVGFDQVANAAFGGDEDEPISSRCWRNREAPHYSALVMLINFLFNDPNHCKDAYESEQRKRGMPA